MNEDNFNIQLRKFLKKVGIQSQREIEQCVRQSISTGALNGSETLKASVRLQLSDIGLDVIIEDEISLS